jgi:hypothetical protein
MAVELPEERRLPQATSTSQYIRPLSKFRPSSLHTCSSFRQLHDSGASTTTENATMAFLFAVTTLRPLLRHPCSPLLAHSRSCSSSTGHDCICMCNEGGVRTCRKAGDCSSNTAAENLLLFAAHAGRSTAVARAHYRNWFRYSPSLSRVPHLLLSRTGFAFPPACHSVHHFLQHLARCLQVNKPCCSFELSHGLPSWLVLRLPPLVQSGTVKPPKMLLSSTKQTCQP